MKLNDHFAVCLLEKLNVLLDVRPHFIGSGLVESFLEPLNGNRLDGLVHCGLLYPRYKKYGAPPMRPTIANVCY